MNGAHLHLLLNHFPVLGCLSAFCLLLYGMIFKNVSVSRAGLVTAIVAGAMVVPAYLTGEEAEHIVEPVIGVNEEAMETHEDAAEYALWTMVMSGAIALGSLAAARNKPAIPSALGWINVVFLAFTFSVLARTAYVGGVIRHSEINSETNQEIRE